MPVIRQAPDNTLAETLGNLGSTLAQGLNPMNQIRSQNILSEIQARQWEIRQKQSIDAANRNAANVFYNSDLPFDAATREMIASQLRSGSLNVTSYIDALTKTGSLKANKAAADMYRATHGNLSPADLESNVAQLIRGEKTAAELDAQESTTRLTTSKNEATIRGAVSARTAADQQANAAPGAAALTESEAYTDPAKANEMLAGGRVRGTTGVLTPAQTDTAQADRDIAGFKRTPLGTAPTAQGQPAEDAATAAREAEATRQKNVAEAETKGLPQTGNVFFGPLPGQPGNTTGAPYSPTGAAPPFSPSPLGGEPTATTPKPAGETVALPNPDAPVALPVPVTRPLPGGGTVVGETGPEAAERQVLDTETRAQVKEAVGGGEAGLNMMALLDRLKVLAKLAQTGGSSQVPVWVDGWLRDHNLVATDRQGILAEMASLFNAQIPQLRKDMGVKFEAGPELSAQGKMIGNPNLPYEVLMGIFARQAAIAQIAIDRRELALRASTPGHPNPLSRADYLNQDAQVMGTLGTRMQEAIAQSGGYTERSQTPPPPPPATSTSSVGNAIRAALEHLGLAQPQTPQTPQPPQTQQSTADELWDVDKATGKLVRVR